MGDTVLHGREAPQGTDQFMWQGTAGRDTLELLLRRNERAFRLDQSQFMWVMEQKDFY